MNTNSSIEWTDKTWNPTTGCTRVSPGCDHCYAFQLHDQRHIAWKKGNWTKAPLQYQKPFSTIQLFPERLNTPLDWKTPSTIFVNSMSDVFHDDIPFEFIRQIFTTMHVARQHTFQLLTKRPERARAFFDWLWDQQFVKMYREPAWAWQGWYPNVWLGTSSENQETANSRIPELLQIPGFTRFISCEPLLNPIDLSLVPTTNDQPALDGIHWVIVGGESGLHARAMDGDWVRSIRDQCQQQNVPFFFKQWGGRFAKNGGRELDGKTWDEFPAQPVKPNSKSQEAQHHEI